MKRLLKGMGVNSPAEYNRIYTIRENKEPDSQDVRRWKELIKKYTGGSFIDLGCLDSLTIHYAHEMYPSGKFYGVDMAQKAITGMKKRFPFAIFDRADIYDLSFDDKIFDYAILGEVLEHLDQPEQAIKEAMRILKPKGILAISVPLDEARDPGAVDGDRHVYSFDQKDIFNLLSKYGSVEIETLRSSKGEQYHFPNIIAFCIKK